jgi:hypothetical protein
MQHDRVGNHMVMLEVTIWLHPKKRPRKRPARETLTSFAIPSVYSLRSYTPVNSTECQ